jgi:hypothetical protein
MALLSSPVTQAADHLDSTSLATNPLADINDVYAWMNGNGAKVTLAMTVSPLDDGARSFGPSVQYVFHVRRYPPFDEGGFPDTVAEIFGAEESKVICTFESNTAGKCWVVDPSNKVLDYVEGDFSAAAGKSSVGGKLKVFAGRRSDPFFFNLAGFLTARHELMKLCGGGTEAACPGALATGGLLDAAGCPRNAPGALIEPIAAQLSTTQDGTGDSVLGPFCPANQADCFAGRNVLAIVVEFDKTLIASDDKPLLSVYGSTHAGQ